MNTGENRTASSLRPPISSARMSALRLATVNKKARRDQHRARALCSVGAVGQARTTQCKPPPRIRSRRSLVRTTALSARCVGAGAGAGAGERLALGVPAEAVCELLHVRCACGGGGSSVDTRKTRPRAGAHAPPPSTADANAHIARTRAHPGLHDDARPWTWGSAPSCPAARRRRPARGARRQIAHAARKATAASHLTRRGVCDHVCSV